MSNKDVNSSSVDMSFSTRKNGSSTRNGSRTRNGSGSSLKFKSKHVDETITDFTNTGASDSGKMPAPYYEKKLSFLRFKIRSLLLPIVLREETILYKIQKNLRSPITDLYFAWTANLGSHTFYVLMLPLPLWFGYCQVGRDLIFVLGFGIYFTGVVKDYLCLPRPASPPLHRITMSHYTSKEYGCPSSHSANATGVVLVCLNHLFTIKHSLSNSALILSVIFFCIYYFSLVFGRIYAGMHGFTDIIIGSIIGTLVFIIRHFTHDLWDSIVYSGNWLVPILLISFYYSLVYFHSIPAENCPCFDDSVSFIGVLLGLELAYWNYSKSSFIIPEGGIENYCVIPYSFKQIGLFKSILRVIVGVTTVLSWKAISKPLLRKIISPIYKKFISIPITTNASIYGCGALMPRYHIDIIIRISSYAILTMLVLFSAFSFKQLGLDCKFIPADYIH